MSIIGKLFGMGGSSGGKNKTSGTPQEAIQQLRETEEMLQKKSDFLETKITQQLALAKKNGTANKKSIHVSHTPPPPTAPYFYFSCRIIYMNLDIINI